jgi:murein L,D-transpeptidase YafK
MAKSRKPAPVVTAVAVAPAAPKPDPEALLVDVYKDIAANRLRDAETKADTLVQAYPNFRLGQLIRGDLYLMHTRPVTTFGAVNGPEEKLKNLREEAMVRLKSLRERPDPDLVPRAILQLRDDQRHALVVDAKRSRLYVYENQGGELKFVTDYYVSQGKLGVNKVKAGDQKTPIGVYYITSRLPGARLPDFYGTGALPLNYPNEWDKLNGRSGSGIWLHGTPSDSYSRPPLSSDGCVVLTNPDLNKLYNSVEPGKTPVVISDRVEFVNKTKWNNDRSIAAKVVDEWRRDFESMNMPKVLENYSSHFKSERGEDVVAWVARQQQPFKGIRNLTVNLRDMTLFFYPGRDDLIVSTFTEEAVSGKYRNTVRKRQYWAKEGMRWKIVSEANL